MAVHDVVVLGAGPSGLSLAAACAAAGLDTACISPRPRPAWPQRIGGWSDELDELLASCVEADWAAPTIHTAHRPERVLDRRYAKLDSTALQQRMTERILARGVLLVDGQAAHVEQGPTGSTVTLASGVQVVARLVVDTRVGSSWVRRSARGPVAYQASYGELIEVSEHPFDLGEMVFMDLRRVPGSRPTDPPTFFHALPLGRQLIYVEETSLIGIPAVPHIALKSRLSRRLQRWGIHATHTLEVQRAQVPMTLPLPDLDQRMLAYGAAASMVHPATGFSVARTVQRAPEVAQGLVAALDQRNDLDAASALAWRAIWPRDHVRCWQLYAFGARFLTTLDHDALASWFDTFFSLSTADWSQFLSADLTSSHLAQVMTRMYAALDPAARFDLMRAGASRPGAEFLRTVLTP